MKPVKIYTTTYCPYCKKAKALFDSLSVPYTEVNVEEDAALRQEMAEKYNWQTVPMITIGEEFIGGFDDLAALQAAGTLMTKLEA
jgi:GrxC family glutaredoxin